MICLKGEVSRPLEWLLGQRINIMVLVLVNRCTRLRNYNNWSKIEIQLIGLKGNRKLTSKVFGDWIEESKLL